MTEIICTAITGACGIVVAYISAVLTKQRKATEARAAKREKESRLSMQLMSASVDLAYVTSLAVTGGHTNGNVEAAQKKAKTAQEEYEKFLQESAAQLIAGE